MSSKEFILRLLANSLERKLTKADLHRLQHRLASMSPAVVSNTMVALSEPQIPCRKQRLSEELYRILLCAVSYRYKMAIRERYTYYDRQFGETGAYLCPRCGSAIEFDFQAYCGSCVLAGLGRLRECSRSQSWRKKCQLTQALFSRERSQCLSLFDYSELDQHRIQIACCSGDTECLWPFDCSIHLLHFF